MAFKDTSKQGDLYILGTLYSTPMMVSTNDNIIPPPPPPPPPPQFHNDVLFSKNSLETLPQFCPVQPGFGAYSAIIAYFPSHNQLQAHSLKCSRYCTVIREIAKAKLYRVGLRLILRPDCRSTSSLKVKFSCLWAE